MNGRLAFAVRAILGAAGAFLVMNGAAMALVSNFSMGIVLCVAMGAAMVFFAANAKFARRHKAVTGICVAGLAAVCGMSLFLAFYGGNDDAAYTEDALIVLGAAVRGDRPSAPLAERLEAALAYHEKNPAAFIVVSGGQGPQESVSEASAMKNWLIARGVPAETIISEDKSGNTNENFRFSKQLLDDMLGEGTYSAAFVTNAFHVFRADGLARQNGLNAAHVHGGMAWLSLAPAYLRECAAVLKFWVLRK